MKKGQKILVLTGGGLAPALNATLYGVITAARKYHYKIYGSLNGWASLVQPGKIIDLTNLNVESVKNRGGTFLRSSRTNPFKVRGGLNRLKANLNKYKIDAVIAIGGDDTLSAAGKLFREENINIIGLPKTIDNDLPATYFSPGFPSAAYYVAKLTAETKEDSAYSLSRVFIIEMYGEKAGWLTSAAALGGADLVIPPEWPFKLANILRLVKKKYKENGNYCVIALSKEARISGIGGRTDSQFDGFEKIRQEFISLDLKEKIESRLGLSAKVIIPTNYAQSGQPIKLDQKIAYRLGQKGIGLIRQKKFGQAAMIDYQKEKLTITEVPLEKIFKPRAMSDDFFDKQKMLPTKKYFDYLNVLIGDFDFIDKNYIKLQRIVSRSH